VVGRKSQPATGDWDIDRAAFGKRRRASVVDGGGVSAAVGQHVGLSTPAAPGVPTVFPGQDVTETFDLLYEAGFGGLQLTEAPSAAVGRRRHKAGTAAEAQQRRADRLPINCERWRNGKKLLVDERGPRAMVTRDLLANPCLSCRFIATRWPDGRMRQNRPAAHPCAGCHTAANKKMTSGWNPSAYLTSINLPV